MAASHDEQGGIERLIDELQDEGFFAYVRPGQVPHLRQKMLEHRWPFTFGCGRDFNADAEDLSEEGVADFLKRIKPFLKKQGVTLRSVCDEMDERGEGYHVVFDGKRFQMCSAEELDLPPWKLVTARAFDLVDTLLATAGADERAYCLYFGGNEQSILFLTRRQFEITKRWPMEDRDRPLPTSELLSRVGK